MRLKDYLHFNSVSRTKMAQDLGITREHMSRILSGKHYPSVKLAKKIELVTGGKVKISDLFEDQNEENHAELS